MGNDSRILETKSVGIVDEDWDENELMLELSIGWIFAKSKKTVQNVSHESMENDKPEEDLNVHSKREIQAPITNGLLNPNALPVCGGDGEAVAHIHEDLNTKKPWMRTRHLKSGLGNLDKDVERRFSCIK